MSSLHRNTSTDLARTSLSSRIGAGPSRSLGVADAASSLKRPASPNADEGRSSRKRMKEDMDANANAERDRPASRSIDGDALAQDLAQELQCGCCSGLVYKPVVVVPCDHFFCGSCCMLWIKNGGTNCPACRSASTAVMPSRALQSMVDVLLRAAPHHQRSEREREQADEIYPTLRAFRIPTPREPSPEPVIPANTDFVQPCPHCSPNNPFHWTCPEPLADPSSNPENAWRVDSGTPPGHGHCGNCEVLLALRAPSTSRCDFCQVSFCGINVQGRCAALPITAQSPHGMTDVIDLIQSPEIYDCFEGNSAEVEVMLDYVRNQHLTPKQIYRQIAAHIQSQRDGFRPLIEQDLFLDIHSVPGGTDPDPNAPRRSICRLCAAEVFLYGLRDWWIRERHKAICDGLLARRTDCPQGTSCDSMNDPGHAKEFNHLIAHVEEAPRSDTSSANTVSSDRSTRQPTPPPAVSALFLPPISDIFPGSSSSLPSISNLVSETGLPRFYPSDDMFFGSDMDFRERPREDRTANPPIAPEDVARTHQESSGTISHTDSSALDFREPSSSQSQRSVEAQLVKNLADYDSDSSCEIEGRDRGADNISADTHRGHPQDELATHFPFSRRSSPFKRTADLDMSMEDVRTIPTPSFASFHVLTEPGTDFTDANVRRGLVSYPMQVE